MDITALILAGGRATRMGGEDKGLIEVNGRPLLAHILEQLTPQCGNIMINANRNGERYAAHGWPVIADHLANHQGPLAGMLAGLQDISTAYMLTLPCDGPYLAGDYAQRMYAHRRENAVAVAQCGDRLQPVYCLIPKSLTASLESCLHSDERKIDRWLARAGFQAVDFSDCPEMFENINTPEQLSDLQARLTSACR